MFSVWREDQEDRYALPSLRYGLKRSALRRGLHRPYEDRSFRARLEQLRQYHLNHPDLPRQDDVVAIYERAQKALVEAGCDL